MSERTYIAIDLKSFYASVECVSRGLDPLTTHLVVADPTRSEKTICLAASPALKSHAVPGRARLFEVRERVRQVNAERRLRAPGGRFRAKSTSDPELLADSSLELDFVIAPPRMGTYMQVAAAVYEVYLQHIAPEHIHVYSIDEVFIDATPYLLLYHLTARQFAQRLVSEVLKKTGVTATAGIAPNLFLCKVAMDIVAKHIPADADGVRIAEMTEQEFRRQLWTHRPLTDFWRVGRGIAGRLERHGMFTMGDVARMSLKNEELLYRLFGVNAELLIDHAWGCEPCTMAAIKAYRPSSRSLSSGQVLSRPYAFEEASLVIREMADQLALTLVEKGVLADQLSISIGYDVSSLRGYSGAVHCDRYGREVPEGVSGGISLSQPVSSSRVLRAAADELFRELADPALLVRRVNVAAGHVLPREGIEGLSGGERSGGSSPRLIQPELFPVEESRRIKSAEERALQTALSAELAREQRQQEAILAIRQRLGKNAILKGMDLEAGATTRERNEQIGGHHV